MGNNYKHLTVYEWDRVAVWRAEGKSLDEIAVTLGRCASTISRKLRRNRSAVYDRYCANQARKRAEQTGSRKPASESDSRAR